MHIQRQQQPCQRGVDHSQHGDRLVAQVQQAEENRGDDQRQPGVPGTGDDMLQCAAGQYLLHHADGNKVQHMQQEVARLPARTQGYISGQVEQHRHQADGAGPYAKPQSQLPGALAMQRLQAHVRRPAAGHPAEPEYQRHAKQHIDEDIAQQVRRIQIMRPGRDEQMGHRHLGQRAQYKKQREQHGALPRPAEPMVCIQKYPFQ